MAIFLCKHCGHAQLVDDKHLAKKPKCPKCQKIDQVQETVLLVKQLWREQSAMRDNIFKLRQKVMLAVKTVSQTQAETLKVQQQNQDLKKALSQTQAEILELRQKIPVASRTSDNNSKGYAFANLPASPVLSDVKDVIQWFKAKQIKVEYEEKDIDISGYFDEIAVQLGDNYQILKMVYENIKRGQQTKGKKAFRTHLNLASYNPEELALVKQFLNELWDNGFILRYDPPHKEAKQVTLSLQTAPQIVRFFQGEWLEWFAWMKVATLLHERKVKFSCLRSFIISFSNQDRREIDLFFLINGVTPLWIECKTGEFRDFNKYQELRKRLKINKSHAILLLLGEPDNRLSSLTGTFEITIVNENTLLGYVSQLL